ncbi:MAG: CHAT domain-containing protein [Blastocatellia bacterium]
MPLPEAKGGNSTLIEEHEVVNLPSASALAVLRRETAGRKPAAKAVAVLADPVFDKDDDRLNRGTRGRIVTTGSPAVPDSPQAGDVERAVKDVGLVDDGRRLSRLPFSGREARSILAVVLPGQGMMALDFKANRANATSAELAQYRIIHFATHGLLDSEHPELSGIVFSLVNEHGEPQDGFLRLHDIFNLNLPAELVVLSACQTALGKDIRGEGLVGLTRGFMYAGAARVVASLWQVSDAATAELMNHFYRRMMRGGLRPAAALQAAQVEMRKQKRWESPYYWAAFVLQGEWK